MTDDEFDEQLRAFAKLSVVARRQAAEWKAMLMAIEQHTASISGLTLAPVFLSYEQRLVWALTASIAEEFGNIPVRVGVNTTVDPTSPRRLIKASVMGFDNPVFAEYEMDERTARTSRAFVEDCYHRLHVDIMKKLHTLLDEDLEDLEEDEMDEEEK